MLLVKAIALQPIISNGKIVSPDDDDPTFMTSQQRLASLMGVGAAKPCEADEMRKPVVPAPIDETPDMEPESIEATDTVVEPEKRSRKAKKRSAS